MNKRILDIRKLNEEGFAYLREVFSDPRFEGDDYDSFYAYLSYLDDTEVLITNYGDMSDFSATILRLFNDVNEDYGNISLGFADINRQETAKKIVMDIRERNSLISRTTMVKTSTPYMIAYAIWTIHRSSS